MPAARLETSLSTMRCSARTACSISTATRSRRARTISFQISFWTDGAAPRLAHRFHAAKFHEVDHPRPEKIAVEKRFETLAIVERQWTDLGVRACFVEERD